MILCTAERERQADTKIVGLIRKKKHSERTDGKHDVEIRS